MRFGSGALWLLIAALLLGFRILPVQAEEPARAPRRAQLPERVPFSPERFIEDFFGGITPEQQEALDDVEISAAEEERFGDEMASIYLKELRRHELKVTDRGRDVEYLRDLVEIVQPWMRNKDRYPKIAIYLVDASQIDARSFPGGTLFFFRGLLDLAGSEAAVVGVVGHELSHLDHGHQLAPLKRMKYFEQQMEGASGGFRPDRMMSAMRVMMEGFTHPFRPEDESQADRDGTTWAYQAGYDPRELGALFLKLSRRDGEQPNAGIPFLQTHPLRVDRHRAIQELYAELQKASPAKKLYIGRKNLDQRVSRAKREFRED